MLFYILLALIALLVLIITCLETFSSYNTSAVINTNAPVTTSQSITIKATSERVYQLIRDINNWEQWHKGVTQPNMTDNFQKGSIFKWKTGGLPIKSTLHTVVPNKKIGWTGKAFGSFAIHNWTFTDDHGHTIVHVEESMEGWLVYLMRNKIQAGLENSMRSWLANLKTKAES